MLKRIRTSGKPVAEIAREYGIIAKNVYNWIKAGVPKIKSDIRDQQIKTTEWRISKTCWRPHIQTKKIEIDVLWQTKLKQQKSH